MDNNIDVVLAQDPYTKNSVFIGLPASWAVFPSKKLSSVVILTNSKYAAIVNSTCENSVTVSVCVDNDKIFFTSIYCPPSGDLTKDLDAISNVFASLDKFIIGGDLNVHLRSLGYARKNDRTDILLDFLTNYDLHLINDPDSPPSFVQGTLSGRPDVTLAGLDVLEKVYNWHVDDHNFSFSDHKYIVFDLDYKPVINSEQRFKTKNKSFSKFNGIIGSKRSKWSEDLHNVKTTADLDSHVGSLMDEIHSIAKSCFRMGDLSYTPTCHWFTDDIRILRNRVSAAYKRHCKYPDNTDYKDLYVTLRKSYKKTVKKAKLNSWTNFCEKTEESYGTLYKYISGKTLKNTDLIFTKLENNSVFDTHDDVGNNLLNAHFQINNLPNNISEYISPNNFSNTNESIGVTPKELQFVLTLQNNNKAPGPDLLDSLIVKNFCKVCDKYFRDLLTKCLTLGHFPSPWKKGKIIFFRKKNKDGLDVKGYRPITLLPIFSKVLERIIKFRITTLLESENFFHNAQYGFREKRSTTMAMKQLKLLVHDLLLKYKYVAVSSIDIQAAFDSISWSHLYTLIDKLPIPQYLKSILKNFISNRYIGYRFSSAFRWFKLFRGCPQGSCLGPLLWIIVADYILKMFCNIFEEIISYADDFVVAAGGNTRVQLEHNMNIRIQKLVELCDELNLSISSNKCVSMLFGRFNLQRRPPIFKIQGASISVKNHLDYLGFRLDGRFKWLEHFNFIREKIAKFTSSVKKSYIRNRGLAVNYRKIWYSTVIEKQISYGAEAWYPDLDSHGLRKLSSCQRLGLLSIIKTYRNVSTDALCVLTGICPLHISLNYQSAADGVLSGIKTIDIDGCAISKDNIMTKLPPSSFPKYNVIHNLRVYNEETTPKCSLNIYTDGSKLESGVGAAFVAFKNNRSILEKKFKLNKLNSVYQAELIAILKALQWFSLTAYKSVHIFTDNLSSTFTLGHMFPNNEIAKDIFEVAQTIQHKLIFISWVKAHVGLIGNERADLLAKNAILGGDDVEQLVVKFPISSIKKWCKDMSLAEWQRDWNNSDKGRDTYTVLNKVNRDFVCFNFVAHYFITGHGSFPAYLHSIKKAPSPLCECGNRGTVTHYLFKSCSLVPIFFKFDKNKTLRQNLQQVLLSKQNYDKLCDIYNALNSKYSFIKYKF